MNNILIYTDVWNTGGIEKILLELIKNFNKNIKISLLVANKESDFGSSELKKHDIKIFEVLAEKESNPIFRTFKTIIKFRENIKKINPEIIHINIYNSVGLIYGWIAYLTGTKKIIIHSHCSGVDNDKYHLKRLVNYFCKFVFTKKTYCYISCSKEAADFCFNTGKIKEYQILKNGIQTSSFVFNNKVREKYRKKYFLKEDCLVVGHVGRFAENKNHEYILKVFKKLNEKVPNSKLFLIGDGKLLEKVKIESVNMHIYENLVFIGNTEKVNEYMQMFDIFVFPSIYEGLGIVAIEAQASGLKCVVSSGVPSAVDISGNVKFLKIDEENISEWANEIIKSRTYERQNLSDCIIKSGYDIKKSVISLESTYASLK